MRSSSPSSGGSSAPSHSSGSGRRR
jgi:hypothetical protein